MAYRIYASVNARWMQLSEPGKSARPIHNYFQCDASARILLSQYSVELDKWAFSRRLTCKSQYTETVRFRFNFSALFSFSFAFIWYLSCNFIAPSQSPRFVRFSSISLSTRNMLRIIRSHRPISFMRFPFYLSMFAIEPLTKADGTQCQQWWHLLLAKANAGTEKKRGKINSIAFL